MIAVDLESYFSREPTIRDGIGNRARLPQTRGSLIEVDLDRYFQMVGNDDSARLGVRLMQWANYVKSKIGRPLAAAEELALLARDQEVMGCSDWWYK